MDQEGLHFHRDSPGLGCSHPQGPGRGTKGPERERGRGKEGRDKGNYASCTELPYPRGHKAREVGTGTWVSEEKDGYLGTPISSPLPTSSRGHRKKEAKLGSSRSSIKRFTFRFPPSQGARPALSRTSVSRVPPPHTLRSLPKMATSQRNTPFPFG